MFYVYILSNYSKTVFYTGMTSDLERRMYEHKNQLTPGFATKYNCNILLYYETLQSGEEAAHREKQIKRYKQEWKRNLIDQMNPECRDLSLDFLED